MRRIRIEEGSYEDYKQLVPFHYIGQRAGYLRKIFRAILDLEGRKELAGVIVYAHPYLELSARNSALPALKRFRRRLAPRKYAKLIDRCFSRIARVIVHPKYRGIGLGTMLVRETMPLAGTPYVEALAVMARYNPFFEKAGMKRIEYASKAEAKIRKSLVELEALGIQPDFINSKKYLRKILETSNPRRLRRIASIARRIAAQKLRRPSSLKRIEELDVDSIVETLSRIRAKPEYFIWRNHKIESPIK